MIRTVIQWMIAQKVDDGVSLGVFLSWVVRRDPLSRQYHESLFRLRERLCNDVGLLMGEATPETGKKPLKILSRSVFFSGSADSIRRRRARNSFVILSLVLVLGAFFSSWFFPAGGTGCVSASPSSGAVTGTIMFDDPLICDELVRLCRQSPNESGPFFIESIR